jgi:hypothetical protein
MVRITTPRTFAGQLAGVAAGGVPNAVLRSAGQVPAGAKQRLGGTARCTSSSHTTAPRTV